MTWWMIALLAYFLPMVITVGLVYEYGISLDGDEWMAFVPFFNILAVVHVAGKALEEIGKARRYGDYD